MVYTRKNSYPLFIEKKEVVEKVKVSVERDRDHDITNNKKKKKKPIIKNNYNHF